MRRKRLVGYAVMAAQAGMTVTVADMASAKVAGRKEEDPKVKADARALHVSLPNG